MEPISLKQGLELPVGTGSCGGAAQPRKPVTTSAKASLRAKLVLVPGRVTAGRLLGEA
jgi:hypothetical protein